MRRVEVTFILIVITCKLITGHRRKTVVIGDGHRHRCPLPLKLEVYRGELAEFLVPRWRSLSLWEDVLGCERLLASLGGWLSGC